MCALCRIADKLSDSLGEPMERFRIAMSVINYESLSEEKQLELALLASLAQIHDTIVNICRRTGDVDAATLHAQLIEAHLARLLKVLEEQSK